MSRSKKKSATNKHHPICMQTTSTAKMFPDYEMTDSEVNQSLLVHGAYVLQDISNEASVEGTSDEFSPLSLAEELYGEEENTDSDWPGSDADLPSCVTAHDERVRLKKAYKRSLQQQLDPSVPVPPPHVHEKVNFVGPMKERSHKIEKLTEELNFILNLRGPKGDRRLTRKQRDTVLEYKARKGHYRKLLEENYTEEKKVYLFTHLYNVLIFQEKLTGRIALHFRSEINEERCAETVVDEGFATITIWSQAFITRPGKRLRRLQQIVVVEMMNAFFAIYGCPRCWLNCPDWIEKAEYGITDLRYSVREALEDSDLLGLEGFI